MHRGEESTKAFSVRLLRFRLMKLARCPWSEALCSVALRQECIACASSPKVLGFYDARPGRVDARLTRVGTRHYGICTDSSGLPSLDWVCANGCYRIC